MTLPKNIFYLGLLVTSLVGCVQTDTTDTEPYQPVINPSDFTTTIDNSYFSLPVGKTLTYEADTADGHERIAVVATAETKEIIGVTTLVYWDRVWLDDVLIEDTHDYLAQDNLGNVWYFGEDVDNYEEGLLVDHDGSWMAGEDGAQPGIWMKANPQVGETYRQEYYQGEAEDMADVISLTETVTIPYGSYDNCLQTYDYTPLDLTSKEYKYYCQAVGGLVLELGVDSGERTELVAVE
ncbi:MAG: hypothetical protein HY565_04575 [Candidatus Kerfeldbacteria bacterium]|nr:hypothetical protein [Candidatus Kerfeldbacteria bacterium]